ncbi:MAG: DUF4338 domain-containing protein [Chloroflexi bacterium]|nr:DUF4338 domain-containing protein [Chloroflexota bacterium]
MEVATQWEWRNPAGQLKDMAARSLLLKLEARGWIRLPLRQRQPSSRMGTRTEAAVVVAAPEPPLTQPLDPLLPLVISEVSTPSGAAQRPLFEALLHQHHYLGYRSWVGQNMQYLVRDGQARPLACVLFGAAAWQCAARDHYLGWASSVRAQHLHFIANNTRFLVVPWARVPHLASYVLSRVARRIGGHWQAKYGHPLYLLETFVQGDRCAGTAYRAANWVRVGQTKGRTRQDRPDGTWHQAALKDVYLYPLHRRFRQHLQGPTAQPHATYDPHDPLHDRHRSTLTPSSPGADP